MKVKNSFLVLILCLVARLGHTQDPTSISKVSSKLTFLEPSEITVNGLLGDAIASDRKGRIATLPTWRDGELIKMFNKEVRDNHNKMDWYGEHAGKWLYTASHAAKHSHNKELETLVIQTADYLVSQQGADGYLGNYGVAVRLTNPNISHQRSWDVWNLSYMTLGLLQMNRYYPNPAYLTAAKSIGELFIRTFDIEEKNITEYGTRRGLSATVILDPVIELYKATKDARYLSLAETIIKDMEANQDHRLITAGNNNLDMEFVGDGKIYQIIWNLLGIVKLYEVTGNETYLKAATNAWQNISDHHLNIAGGPWGGIGKHMECFNRKNFWSPYGLVETCSTMSWIQLNKELLRLTGSAKYAQAIEKSAYNALLGARFPNGIDWSYHSFTNGNWSVANFNDCCPSSGALALEELPALIFSKLEKGIAVNLYTDSEATMNVGKTNTIRITQKTQYPYDGKIQLTFSLTKKESFPLLIRIPEWTTTATILLNNKVIDSQQVKNGEYFKLDRTWNTNDVLEINFPLQLSISQKSEQLDGPQNADEIYEVSWFAINRGPLVYAANGLIDGKDRERTLPVNLTDVNQLLIQIPSTNASPRYELKLDGMQPLLFMPYYEAGGEKKGGWRLTWLPTKIH